MSVYFYLQLCTFHFADVDQTRSRAHTHTMRISVDLSIFPFCMHELAIAWRAMNVHYGRPLLNRSNGVDSIFLFRFQFHAEDRIFKNYLFYKSLVCLFSLALLYTHSMAISLLISFHTAIGHYSFRDGILDCRLNMERI